MKLKLKINGKTMVYSSFGKRKVLGLVATMSSKEEGIIEGTVRVEYGGGDYNEFSFIGSDDYRKKLGPCIDDSLMDYLEIKHV